MYQRAGAAESLCLGERKTRVARARATRARETTVKRSAHHRLASGFSHTVYVNDKNQVSLVARRTAHRRDDDCFRKPLATRVPNAV